MMDWMGESCESLEEGIIRVMFGAMEVMLFLDMAEAGLMLFLAGMEVDNCASIEIDNDWG